MKLLSELISTPLTKQMSAFEREIAGDITGIMTDEVKGLKSEYRSQVIEAGMGQRLANTWQSETYPKGSRSLNPAGYLWSNAPAIIDAFARGAAIRPVSGGKYLWIPTRNVPRRRRAGSYSSSMGRRSSGSAMTPEEVELHFNAELEIVFEGGKGFAFIDVVSGLSGGFRRATAARVQGRRNMAPRKAKKVLMFTLTKGVKMPRLFDLQGPAERAAQRIARRIAQRWG